MPIRFPHVTAILALIAALSSCAAPRGPDDPRLSGPSASDLSRMAAPARPGRLVARNRDEVADIAAAAGRVAEPGASGARRMKFIEISAIPYLRRSTEGAHFLTLPAPRALARGEPPERCPSAAVGQGGDASGATAAALDACLAHVPEGADCGCRVLAVNNVLTAPNAAFAFAPAVAAHLIWPENGRLRALVAESEPPDGGIERVLLRDAKGEVGRLIMAGRHARLAMAADPGAIIDGAREPFGYRRGRLAERIRFTGPDGQRVTLLIGVERRDALASN